MCRVVAYLGEPIGLGHVLFETDSSLVKQSYSPRMMNRFLNLAGFGMVAWDPRSLNSDEPFAYRAMTLPQYDRNLRGLVEKLAPTCLIAHVRGTTDSSKEVISETNLHPFRFHGAGVALAHNGHLRRFAEMRYDLIEHVRPELLQHIRGTTDSEWIYALLLSQLDDPFGTPDVEELAEATAAALRTLREVRARHEIDISSPVNLFITTGTSLVVTRFSFDYGWYPEDDILLETDLPYVSLWYTLGGQYAQTENGFAMGASDRLQSLLIASEPLTVDISSWLEVPEYSMLTAATNGDALEFEVRDLDV
jgi:predicted glutamine amidotransferase